VVESIAYGQIGEQFVYSPFVEVALPIARYLAGGTRHRLVERMVLWRREPRTLQHGVSLVVVKPILTRLKAADY